MNWILFYHIGTLDYYFWNGEYPINVNPQGALWDIHGKIDNKEIAAITSVIGNRKRTFSIKGRGDFHVVEKGKFIQK